MRHGSELWRAAVEEGLVQPIEEAAFAEAIGRLVGADFVRFGSTNGGHRLLHSNVSWNSFELQSHGDYELTATGRQEARAAIGPLPGKGAPGNDVRDSRESSDVWFHVHLFVRDTPESQRGRQIDFFNLAEADLAERVVDAWDQGLPIVWDGRQVEPSLRTNISIYKTEEHAPQDARIPLGDDVTNEWIRGSPGRLAANASGLGNQSETRDPRKVMVVYGRNEAGRAAMFSFLRAVGLSPIEWDQAVAETGQGSPHNLDAVRSAMAASQAVVVLLTAEDQAGLLPELSGNKADRVLAGQPRQNVLLEAGLALGIASERTILVELGRLRRASDFEGLNTVRLSNDGGSRNALRSRLANAGCSVDPTGADWLSAAAGGDFDAAIVDWSASGRPGE